MERIGKETNLQAINVIDPDILFPAPYGWATASNLNNGGDLRGGGLTQEGLIFFAVPGGVDSIGLSVADYSLLSAYWQAVFFADPTTPITHTYDEWMVILLADAATNINDVAAIGGAGFIVGAEGTTQITLDAWIVYLQNRVPVEPTGDYPIDINGDYPVDINGDYANAS